MDNGVHVQCNLFFTRNNNQCTLRTQINDHHQGFQKVYLQTLRVSVPMLSLMTYVYNHSSDINSYIFLVRA